ncbi:MAG: LytTR family DNA-binding domain-containing protein [Thermotaleaceae bacterium]
MRVVIVDDEIPAVNEIKFLLGKYPDVEIVGEGYDGEEALQLAEMLKPDILFLDIHMNHLDGIETAYQLLKRPYCPYLVFATGYDEYAVRAFELNAVDYILKPFYEERMDKTIEKLRQSYRHKENMDEMNQQRALSTLGNLKLTDKIAVWDQEKIKIIDFQQILYLTVDGRQSVIMTESGRYLVQLNLKELELKLPPEKFMRTHRAYIVNLENIDEIQLWFNNTFMLRMKNCEDEIPVSRTYVKEFRQGIGL